MTQYPATPEGVKAFEQDNPSNFPRQPGVVVITFSAELPSDTERYISRVHKLFDQYSGDDISRSGQTLTIYPRAVND